MSPPARIVVPPQPPCLEELLLTGAHADCSVCLNGQKPVDAHALILKWRVPYFLHREAMEGTPLRGVLMMDVGGVGGDSAAPAPTRVHLQCTLRCAYGGQLVLSDITDFPALLALGKYLLMDVFCEELRQRAAEVLTTSTAVLELDALQAITDPPLVEYIAGNPSFVVDDPAHLTALADIAVRTNTPALLSTCLTHADYGTAPALLAYALAHRIPHAVRYCVDLLISEFAADRTACVASLRQLPVALAAVILQSDFLPVVLEGELRPVVDALAVTTGHEDAGDRRATRTHPVGGDPRGGPHARALLAGVVRPRGGQQRGSTSQSVSAGGARAVPGPAGMPDARVDADGAPADNDVLETFWALYEAGCGPLASADGPHVYGPHSAEDDDEASHTPPRVHKALIQRRRDGALVDRGDLHDWTAVVVGVVGAVAMAVYRGVCDHVFVRLTPRGVRAEWEVRQLRVLDSRKASIDLTRRLETSGSFEHTTRSFAVTNLLDSTETNIWSAPASSQDACWLQATLPKSLRPAQLLLTFPRLAQRASHIEVSVSSDGVDFVTDSVVQVLPTRTLPVDLSGIWELVDDTLSEGTSSDAGNAGEGP